MVQVGTHYRQQGVKSVENYQNDEEIFVFFLLPLSDDLLQNQSLLEEGRKERKPSRCTTQV